MSNKFIYPILIIIFSVLIIYAILNGRNNQRLNNNIEKFINSPPVLDGESQDLSFNIQNNTNITLKFANGNWTTPYTNFNKFPIYRCGYENEWACCCNYESSDQSTCYNPTAYWCTDYMTITITDTMEKSPNSASYGTIFNPNGRRDIYNITYILNETITGVLQNNSNNHIQIKFLNRYNGETYGNLTNARDTFTSVVTIFAGDSIILKYESFKLIENNCLNGGNGQYCGGDNSEYNNSPNLINITSNNFISSQTRNILSSQNGVIDQDQNTNTGGNFTLNPAEVYDINAYKIIISPTYKYPSNFITLSFGDTPSTTTLNNIQTNYGGNINLCIQRLFQSPTRSIIQSVRSKLLSVSVLRNGQIPKKIIISSFQSDMEANNLKTFFKPYRTNLFIQKLESSNLSYSYSDSSMITVNSSNFNLQNNANNMYQQFVQFPDLNSLTQTNNQIYQVKFIGYYPAPTDISEPTEVNFGDLNL